MKVKTRKNPYGEATCLSFMAKFIILKQWFIKVLHYGFLKSNMILCQSFEANIKNRLKID